MPDLFPDCPQIAKLLLVYHLALCYFFINNYILRRKIMSSTLQQAIECLQPLKIVKQPDSIADKLLGRFRGIIPPDKTSTKFIKELRGNLYGKTSQ